MIVMLSRKVNTITEKGKKSLGTTLKYFREQKDWSMEDLITEVSNATGYKVSKSTISQLERGNADPKWNTLAVLAAAEFITDKKGTPLTTNELFAIACEEISLDALI
jgi:transcriptional regulator with XRE-family HTH domain